MTGYQSKRAMARDKLDDDDDTQVYKDHGDALTIAYQSGYYDGKKAALAQPAQEQEPVAWLHPANANCVTTDPTAYARGIPLYTTPQQRPWVGLTDEQKHYLNEVLNLQGRFPIIDAIEAKSKELNT